MDHRGTFVLARFLSDALEELRESFGYTVTAAFEHEFNLLDDGLPSRPGFSYLRQRDVEPFPTNLMHALDQAGLLPETFLPEFGAGQFEFTCKPAPALKAADIAVSAREIVREVAARHGNRATFSPKVASEGVGNGVHIHFSIQDKDGHNVLYEPKNEYSLSDFGGHFSAGIIKYLPEILSFTAPSVMSYQRLKPHHWSSAYTCMGDKNREATLRICPMESFSGKTANAQYNLEYRASDATANPYLALGVIIRAGLAGLRENLSRPPAINTDPSEMSDEERTAQGVHRLPETLEQALSKTASSEVPASWFSNSFLTSYIETKKSEIEATANLEAEALCQRFNEIY